MVRLRATSLALALVALLGSALVTSSGQADERDAATATALYKDGLALMKDRRFAEACPKLVESQRLDPGGGTLVAIALCHEGQGALATAWADWDEALTRAKSDSRADREAAARQHIAAIEPRLSRFKIVVAASVPGLEVKRDGQAVGPAQWGTAIPVDPGDHTFAATAPGALPWQKRVATPPEGKTVEIVVPSLEALPLAAPPPVIVPPAPVVATPPPRPPPVAPPGPDDSAGASQRLAGLVIGGAGAAALIAGGAFGIAAIAQWSSASSACPSHVCQTQAEVDAGKTAGQTADASSVLVGIGVAALAAGAIVYFLAPHGEAERVAPADRWVSVLPLVDPHGAGASVGGAF